MNIIRTIAQLQNKISLVNQIHFRAETYMINTYSFPDKITASFVTNRTPISRYNFPNRSNTALEHFIIYKTKGLTVYQTFYCHTS